MADVTSRNSHIEGAGSSGIYLETGSIDGVVENNVIVDNGYGEIGPDGQFFETLGVPVWFWGTGRESLSIDLSRFNAIRNNSFHATPPLPRSYHDGPREAHRPCCPALRPAPADRAGAPRAGRRRAG